MDQIPFHLETPDGIIEGYLNVVDKSKPPTWFHVMVKQRDGHYYAGQLLFRQDGWHLPSSKLEKYAEELGRIVEVWYQ